VANTLLIICKIFKRSIQIEKIFKALNKISKEKSKLLSQEAFKMQAKKKGDSVKTKTTATVIISKTIHSEGKKYLSVSDYIFPDV